MHDQLLQMTLGGMVAVGDIDDAVWAVLTLEQQLMMVEADMAAWAEFAPTDPTLRAALAAEW